jgi:TRAP-type C4-dicarboxylate transport system permease small subunit
MNTVMERVEKIHHSLKIIGVYTGGIATILMMIVIVSDVFLRNVFNSPVSGAYEVVQFYLMPLAIFPALAYTYSSGILPRLTELIEKAPRIHNVTTYIILIIELIIFALLTVYGWKFAMAGVSDQMAVPVGGNLLPLYPLYFVVPIGFGLVLLEVVISGYKTVAKKA